VFPQHLDDLLSVNLPLRIVRLLDGEQQESRSFGLSKNRRSETNKFRNIIDRNDFPKIEKAHVAWTDIIRTITPLVSRLAIASGKGAATGISAWYRSNPKNLRLRPVDVFWLKGGDCAS
jgi:hypothetical protein